MNTSVFSSSIFFIADSVVSGYLMILNLSSSGFFAIALRGYIGLRACFSVFGRKKCTFLRTFDVFFAIDFFTIFVVAFAAGFGACFAAAFFGSAFAAALGSAFACAL